MIVDPDSIRTTQRLLDGATQVIQGMRKAEEGIGSGFGPIELGERIVVAQLLMNVIMHENNEARQKEALDRQEEARKRHEELKVSMVEGLPLPARAVPPEEMPKADQLAMRIGIYRTAFGWVLKADDNVELKYVGARTHQEFFSALGRIGLQIVKKSGEAGGKP